VDDGIEEGVAVPHLLTEAEAVIMELEDKEGSRGRGSRGLRRGLQGLIIQREQRR